MNFKKLLLQGLFWRGLYFLSVLVVNIFLSRYLQAAGTGNLYFITIIFSFVQVVLSLGLEAGIIYHGSGELIHRNKLTGLIAVWSFVSGLIMALLVFIFFTIDESLPDDLSTQYILYAMFFVAGMSLMNYTTALYYTQDNYVLPNLLISIINFGFVLFIPPKQNVISVADANQITLFYFIVFLIQGISVFLSFVIRNRHAGNFGFPSGSDIRSFFKYSVTALAANVIFFLVYRIDYLFVKASEVSSDADLGNYIQVSKLGQMLLVIPQIIASVVFPKTATGIARQEMNASIQIIARLFSQLFLLMFVLVAIFGDTLFPWIFGESFNRMQFPMLILIPGIFSLSVLALLSAYFSGKGKVEVNVKGAFLALIVMVVCDVIFVPRYGIIVAALISTLSYTVNLSYSMWQFYKDYSIKWIEFVRWKKADYHWLLSVLVKEKR